MEGQEQADPYRQRLSLYQEDLVKREKLETQNLFGFWLRECTSLLLKGFS
jgi:hypothetical protein